MTKIVGNDVIISKSKFGFDMWDQKDYEEIVNRSNNSYFSKIIKTHTKFIPQRKINKTPLVVNIPVKSNRITTKNFVGMKLFNR